MAKRRPRGQYSSEDMARIIERAAKIDEEPTEITETELREIAAEVGIGEAALVKALQQEHGGHTDRPLGEGLFTQASVGTSGLLVGGSSLAIGAVTAALWANLAGHPIEWVGLTGIGIVDLLLARVAANRRAPGRFQFLSISLWSGFVAGYSIVIPGLAAEVFTVGGACALLCAALGGLFVRSGPTSPGWLHRLAGWFRDRRVLPNLPPSA